MAVLCFLEPGRELFRPKPGCGDIPGYRSGAQALVRAKCRSVSKGGLQSSEANAIMIAAFLYWASVQPCAGLWLARGRTKV